MSGFSVDQLNAEVAAEEAARQEGIANAEKQGDTLPAVEPGEASTTADTAPTQLNVVQDEGSEPPVSQDSKDSSYWQHRCEVLQGKLKAESERWKASLIEKDSEISRLRGQLDALESIQTMQSPVPSNGKVDPSAISDAEIIALYGEDMVDEQGMEYLKLTLATARATQQPTQADPRVDEMQARIQKQDEEAFYRELTNIKPNWVELNANPNWGSFQRTTDQASGLSYGELLQMAVDAKDANRAALVLTQFEKASGSPKRHDVNPNPSPSIPNMDAGSKLTSAEYERQLDELEKLRPRMSPYEYAKKQKQLDALYESGRVVSNV